MSGDELRAGDEILGLTRTGSVHRVLSTWEQRAPRAASYILAITPKGWRRAFDLSGVELRRLDGVARVWRVVR